LSSLLRSWLLPDGLFGAISPKIQTIEVYRLAAGNHRLPVAVPRVHAMRLPKEIPI
jgi:hypothetical protein